MRIRPVFTLVPVRETSAGPDPVYRLTAPGITSPVSVGMVFLSSLYGVRPFGTSFMVQAREFRIPILKETA